MLNFPLISPVPGAQSNTAIGYSTILEFSSKPISAVLGDQDAFKLEYVANSITIKPLLPRAESNLFIFTDYERFNCQLVTGTKSQVDYIVRIQAKTEKPYPLEGIRTDIESSLDRPLGFTTRKIHQTASYAGYLLDLVSISREHDLKNPRAVTLLDFELSSKRTLYHFSAGALGVRQGGQFLNIESLYLDSLDLIPGDPPIHGKLALLSHDFKPNVPVTLIFTVPKQNDQHGVYRLAVEARSSSPNIKPKSMLTVTNPIPFPIPIPSPSITSNPAKPGLK